MSAIYEERDGLLVPSAHARGPWDPQSQHGGGPSALMARAVERLDSAAPMLLARLAIEFVGAVPMSPLTVEARVVKPGKRLQLAEVSLSADGREACRGRAVLIRREPVSVPARAIHGPRIDPPDDVAPEDLSMMSQWGSEGFALTGMELRFVAGRFIVPGPTTAWFRLKMPLVAGEETSPAQRVMAAADFGNGMAAELGFDSHLFVNTDLTVHLAREPVGEWIGVEAVTEHGPEGTALAATVLHDVDGPVGRGAQALFVAER